MARFRLDIEYEGTRYSGWQMQPNGRTIQGEFFRAIEQAFSTRTYEFQGSGRTDAGVHALAQTAHLGVETTLAPPVIRLKLNDLLPADINVLRVQRASPTFHARHDALTRSYLYQISRRRTAFGKRFVWWIKDSLNLKRMEEAGRLFVGSHDFRSFTADRPQQKDTRVVVGDLTLQDSGDLILLRVQASHFLWKMVRQMVGVLVEVGRGNLSAADVQQFLHEPSDRPAQLTSPPSGLFLERAIYPEDRRAGERGKPLADPRSVVLVDHW